MALLLILPGKNVQKLKDRILHLAPDLDVRIWPEPGNPNDLEMVVTWKQPPGELGKFPGLKVVMSFGAGVDHILDDPGLPAGATVCRVVDPSLVHDLTEYMLAVVLARKRLLAAYQDQQKEGIWKPVRYEKDPVIGIFGLGQIGSKAAGKFRLLGFRVLGWSRTPKQLPGIETFDAEGLDDMLPQADYLICVLPLTAETRGILNSTLFGKMKKVSYLINIGRGLHLVEDDLLQALDDGLLAGACLDVFQTEPLPEDHPFWDHPAITLTPHIGALTDTKVVVSQIIENYRRLARCEPLLNIVDRERGY